MLQTYHLRLLGHFDLQADGQPVPFAAGKGLAILAYLATARDRQAARQALTDLLWDDVSRERARSSLRQAIFAIRRTLGDDVITGDGEWLTLSPAVSTDLDAFQRALRDGAMDQAVTAYGGPFLPDDVARIATRPFEQWVTAERQRLKSAFVAAARAHHQLLLDRNAIDRALQVATQLRDADAHSDEAWHPLFLTLAAANRYAVLELEAEALRAARSIDGDDVQDATMALLQRLRRQRPGAPEMSASAPNGPARIPMHPAFQGRADVVRDLFAAWSRARSGQAASRLIEAAPGLGKTRLLQELARRMRVERVRVVSVTCRHREQDDPYALLADLTVQLARLPGAAGVSRSSAGILAGLAPDLVDTFQVAALPGPSHAAELLRYRMMAFADLCGAVADEAPCCVQVDDLQWADAVSVQCLSRALTRLTDKPLLFVGASRTAVAIPGERLTLQPLHASDVGALLTSIAAIEAPGWSDAHTEELTRACAGSPFRILQGLRSAVAGGAVTIVGNRWMAGDWERFVTLINPLVSLHERLLALSATDRVVIAVLAAIDRPVQTQELLAVVTGGPDALQASLLHLDRDGLVTRLGTDAWDFAHALVADEAAQVLPHEIRQWGAARLGQVLAATAQTKPQVREAVQLLLDGDDSATAVDVVERLLERSGFSHGATSFALTLADSRSDTTFAAHVRAIDARRRRRRQLRTAAIAASVLVTMAMAGLGMHALQRTSQESRAVRVPRAIHLPALVPDGLTAYFPLDGSALNGVNDVASGTPATIQWVPDRTGAVARAAGFQRTGHIALPPQVLNDMLVGTMTLWASWDGSDGIQALTSKQLDNDNTWGVLSINGYSGRGGQPTPGDRGRLYYHGSHEHESGRVEVLRGAAVLQPNRWYHVAVTWDTLAMHLYVDGVHDARVRCDYCGVSDQLNDSTITRFGDWVPDGRHFRFGGALDDVRIYRRVLTSEEIRTLARR